MRRAFGFGIRNHEFLLPEVKTVTITLNISPEVEAKRVITNVMILRETNGITFEVAKKKLRVIDLRKVERHDL